MIVSGVVEQDGNRVGEITAAAMSPYLGHSIGYVLLNSADLGPGDKVYVSCRDGSLHEAELVELPMYDKERQIPRGKRVDIPTRPDRKDIR